MANKIQSFVDAHNLPSRLTMSLFVLIHDCLVNLLPRTSYQFDQGRDKEKTYVNSRLLMKLTSECPKEIAFRELDAEEPVHMPCTFLTANVILTEARALV